ncbi:EAL domain-containing protein [Colwellia sp. 1_MG-2023]|uniref:two-component system response regulator n=1 Tax=unclassified Colwellia TaxID=196834 RepID=UPI001C095A5D|nr:MULTISPECIES: EAL domain-containing protein [unclassified Colwellia]MBU2924636.1 EAL domain-containing protein [Colwellia sp. C2M11]MDO6488683.1 EAL domain-containing protein [Colwellia sp. 6_MG-2023]MDO6653892.1 EAL domain-containing protein [Colwellia sp. 3_MG-2023]MDO6666719.1 EAL domain-containing protein [Colwellia sp. 2_MG-2023]MDO6691160.1 EAL domain-containing protein [Colwellia sp. 1_MG-2023]
MKILIVDDNEIDIALAKRALGTSLENNYEIKGTDCVAKALVLIDEEVFDIILLDYHMPEINGIEMIIEMRSRPNLGNTAIIVISAAEDISIALNCIEAGAQDFIPKSDISHIKLSQAIIHSKKRFEMEQRMQESYLALKNMAETDQLTGLHNRHYFDETLNIMIANSDRLKLSVGMLILDLDDFKHINDSLGHHAGDILLVELVARVKNCLRINDGFARLGGDEFAITLANINSAEEVNMIASRILQSFQQPFLIDGQRMDCTVSIGAALYPDDANSHDQLMKYADVAMYRAKKNGKNTLCFYELHYQNEFNRRFFIRNEMNEIIKNSSFRLFYQPIFCANSENIKGVEALIRWPDTPNSYTPDEFIPIAEETRLIHDLGQWVIDTALANLASWQTKYDNNFTLAINISAIQLQNAQLTQKIKYAAQKYGVKPDTIILEITETALLDNDNITRQTLNSLSSAGFKIALDDFGMGFSSISHLNNYPIDIVKLDKTLQEDELNTDKKNSLLEAVTLMLKLLNFTVVAEGIETKNQLKVCRKLKIDKFQGYLLGMPMPADLLEVKLQEQR